MKFDTFSIVFLYCDVLRVQQTKYLRCVDRISLNGCFFGVLRHCIVVEGLHSMTTQYNAVN